MSEGRLHANDFHPDVALRHGAYVCLRVPQEAQVAAARAAVPALAERLGLSNEFDAAAGHPEHAIAFLRRVGATPEAIADDGLLHADAIVHVASSTAAPVNEFCAELAQMLPSPITWRVLRGSLRPANYTGVAMYNFAYAHQVIQQPGRAMPNAFLVPMSKTPEWWAKDWMERHTYFLPRFNDAGHMLNQGHPLAAAAGIECLMRRTYKHETLPAPAGEYDFVNYFECADDDIPTFQSVRAALRDVARNPEWRFAREGPTWHGRRAADWAGLFAP